jgi:uncharacterized damage-inducible protein DinB
LEIDDLVKGDQRHSNLTSVAVLHIMTRQRQPEVWLRGPVPGVAPLLQPIAHGLLQCREELQRALEGLTPEQIWARPFGAASLGFHAWHAAGSLDRLFTYARGERLSAEQQSALAAEGEPDLELGAADRLLARFSEAVDNALTQLRSTSEASLVEPRFVGRAQLPSTVIGLLFHAAEHTQRHMGQAVTTAKVLTGSSDRIP